MLGDDRGDAIEIEPREVAGQHVVGDHDRAALERRAHVAIAEQLLHHAPADVLDVHHAVAEVGVLDPAERLAVGAEHVDERAARIAGVVHRLAQLRHEALVLEDLDVGVEDRREVGAEAVAQLFAVVVEVAAHDLDRLEQIALFRVGARPRRVLEHREVERVLHAVHRPDRDPARRADPAELDVVVGARVRPARDADPVRRELFACCAASTLPTRPRARAGARSSRSARSAAHRSGTGRCRAPRTCGARRSGSRARRSSRRASGAAPRRAS